MPAGRPRRHPHSFDVRAMDRVKHEAELAATAAINSGDRRWALAHTNAFNQLFEHGNPEFYTSLQRLKRFPVTIDEFVESKEYLGEILTVWEPLRNDLRAMNPDVIIGETPVHQALLGGATGTGKTLLSHITNLYQLYLLTCFDKPQLLFGLTPATTLVLMFQSVSATVTKRVIYEPFRRYFLSMPYTKRWVRYDKDKESVLSLEGHIEAVPALADVTSMVGQAIIGGLLDEINFLQIVEQSKKVPGQSGNGGFYDQAESTYTNLVRRRKSRFTTRGVSIGTLCVSSSVRYKDDFMDRRMREVVENEEPNIVVLRRKQYEVRPANTMSSEKFRFLVGTDGFPPRVLQDHEQPGIHFPERAQVEHIPVDYLHDFRRDPEGSMRDVVGAATHAISSFILQRHKITEAVLEGERLGLLGMVDVPNTDLGEQGLPQWSPERMPDAARRSLPRWVHIDLSITGDRCGIAVVRPAGNVNQLVGDSGTVETLPKFVVEAAMSVQPSQVTPLDFGELRAWLMQLINPYGFNLAEVTFDGFESTESQQLWRKAGVPSREVSVDRTDEPYKYLRRALYDGRIALPKNELLTQELVALEWRADKSKVDHPPRKSKDVADAVCGAVWAAGMSPRLRATVGYAATSGQTTSSIRQRPRRIRPNRKR